MRTGGMEHWDDKVMEHYETSVMENFDERGYGAF